MLSWLLVVVVAAAAAAVALVFVASVVVGVPCQEQEKTTCRHLNLHPLIQEPLITLRQNVEIVLQSNTSLIYYLL